MPINGFNLMNLMCEAKNHSWWRESLAYDHILVLKAWLRGQWKKFLPDLSPFSIGLLSEMTNQGLRLATRLLWPLRMKWRIWRRKASLLSRTLHVTYSNPTLMTLSTWILMWYLLQIFWWKVPLIFQGGSEIWSWYWPYNIHSPRIPSTEEIVDRVNKMLNTNIFSVNLNCGIKTRKYT